MTIEDAIAFAAEKHKGQPDKAGRPYIWHPLRVALKLDCECAQLAAVLHDVVEDTGTTLADLRKLGVPPRVLKAIQHLTKRRNEKGGEPNYLKFIRRAKKDPIARLVKEADLRDNLDPTRLALLSPEQRRKCRKKYVRALALLRKR